MDQSRFSQMDKLTRSKSEAQARVSSEPGADRLGGRCTLVFPAALARENRQWRPFGSP